MSTVEELKQQIHEDLEELRAGLLEYIRGEDRELEFLSESGRSRLEATINETHNTVEALRAPAEVPLAATASANQQALQAIAALGSLEAQFNYFDARAALPLAAAAAAAWAGLSAYLKTILQKISSQLWQLLARLLTLKEWSVAGSAGVSLFGLGGNAQIQLTFG
jgi:hypothetical protein